MWTEATICRLFGKHNTTSSVILQIDLYSSARMPIKKQKNDTGFFGITDLGEGDEDIHDNKDDKNKSGKD